MASTSALLLGGPCDQTTRTLPSSFNFNKPLVCKGTNYFAEPGTSDPTVFVAERHVWVVLKGPPCGGRNVGLTFDQFRKGALMCQGHLYVNVLSGGHPLVNANGANVWEEARQLENSAAPQAAYSTRQPFTAMGRLLRTLAVYVPEQQKQQRAALRRLRRAVR